jgi:hypothetical protein
MTSMAFAVFGSKGHRLVPSLFFVVAVAVFQAIMLPAGTMAADGEDAKTADAARQDEQKDDALLPVAFRMAATGALDASAPNASNRSGASTGDAGIRPWRDARSRVPRSPRGSGLYNAAAYLDDAGGHAPFSLSRGIAPLLVPPVLSSGDSFVANVSADRTPGDVGRGVMKFRSSVRNR